jgi:hypothetical protein
MVSKFKAKDTSRALDTGIPRRSSLSPTAVVKTVDEGKNK